MTMGHMKPGAHFQFTADAANSSFVLRNIDCDNCCWQSAAGSYDAAAAALTVHTSSPGACGGLLHETGRLVWANDSLLWSDQGTVARRLCVQWAVGGKTDARHWPMWCHV